MSKSTATKVRAARESTSCAECGAVLEQPGTFHPYMFCVLKKAGRDPWEDFAWCYERLTGNSLPGKPPLVRDLPAAPARGEETA